MFHGSPSMGMNDLLQGDDGTRLEIVSRKLENMEPDDDGFDDLVKERRKLELKLRIEQLKDELEKAQKKMGGSDGDEDEDEDEDDAGYEAVANLLNLGGNNTAAAVSMGGGATITGLTIGTQVGTHRTQATGEASMTFGGALFLGSGQAIVVEYDTGTTGLCEIDCIFNYKVKL
jgi:hypothetical protein